MAAHIDHGNTPAAWTGVIISFVGFIAAAGFILAKQPVPFWASIGVVLLGPLVGGIMRTMGLGSTAVPVRLVGDGKDSQAPSESAEQEEQAVAHA